METRDRDPDNSFVHQYVRYTEKQESPLSFHLWSALTVLSAAMGRKCFINRGFYVLYPNLFTVLVAGSALCRKSTAVGLARDLLDGIDSTLVFRGKITPEKLIKDIAEGQYEDEVTKEWIGKNVLIFSSELSTFLTKQSYGEPIIYLLTDLFDCPKEWQSRTKNAGSDVLRNVFVSILAATTPDGVARGIPESALQEGFASRIMFVFESSTDRTNAFPELSDEEKAILERCRGMLKSRATLSGAFNLDPEAREWFRNWYEASYKVSQPRDRRLEGFFGRKHDHLLRIAMLLAGSFNDKTIITSDLESALKAVESVEDGARGAFQEIGTTHVTQHFARLKAYFRQYKRIHHSVLLKIMYPCLASELRDMIETAIQSQFIMRDKLKANVYIYLPDNDNTVIKEEKDD